MPLIIDATKKLFDTSQIQKGMLVFAQHRTWTEGRRGFATAVAPHEIIVQYHPGISNVTNHMIIKVQEVVDGKWKIRWSDDLTEVFEYEGE